MYSIGTKGERVYVLKNGKRMHTPKGNLVYSDSEAFSEKLAMALNSGEDYSQNSSLLCYHFSYCDLVTEFTSEDVVQDISQYCSDTILEDEYLMFRQEGEREKVAKKVAGNINAQLSGLNMRQLVAILVIINSTNSLVLAHRIISDLIEKGCSKEQKELFLKDLMAYEVENFGDDIANDAEKAELQQQMREMVETFIMYFSWK